MLNLTRHSEAHRLHAETADLVPSLYAPVRPPPISAGLCFLNLVSGEEFAQRKDLMLKAEKTSKKESRATLDKIHGDSKALGDNPVSFPRTRFSLKTEKCEKCGIRLLLTASFRRASPVPR